MNTCRLAIGAVALAAACGQLFLKKEEPKAEKTPTLEPANCKDGYCEISKGPFAGKKIEFKQTPVTSAEWADVAKGLGEDRYVLLRHDSNSGETRIERKGKTAEELLPENLRSEAAGIQFDQGRIMMEGTLVLLKMVDKPSAIFDKEGRRFSEDLQPVVGVTYFHAVTWALLKSQEEGGRYRYDLPTDEQQQYVASNAGRCTYGTEACTSIFKGDKKLAHINEWNDGRGTTVAVNDPRYEQRLPFGVQTTGNVWRWIKFNAEEIWKYGLRGGSWFDDPGNGQASVRGHYDVSGPGGRDSRVGFSVVRQDS